MKLNLKLPKTLFWTTIAATIASVVNLILFIILSHFGIVGVRNMAYLFAIGFIAVVWVPVFIYWIFKIDFSLTLLICFDVFMFLSIAFASLWGGYGLVPYLDKILHFASGVLFALLIYEIYANNSKNKLTLFWIFMLTFSFAMMCGGVWEIYEFTTDILFNNNSQGTVGLLGREAIMDTMGDLIADFVGSILGGGVAVVLQWKKNKTIKQTENKTLQKGVEEDKQLNSK